MKVITAHRGRQHPEDFSPDFHGNQKGRANGVGQDIFSLAPVHQQGDFIADDTRHEGFRQPNGLYPDHRTGRRGDDFEGLRDMFVHNEELRPVGMRNLDRHIDHAPEDIGG